ncbi:MAG: hypothetical protein AAGF57_09210 [Pseudomonadota bacterium]
MLLSCMALCACVGVGEQRVAEPVPIMDLSESETFKPEVFEVLGLPWDIFHNSESDSTAWVYLYSEIGIGNPLTYVPYVGLVAGGANVYSFARAYCFNPNGQLFGRAIFQHTDYRSVLTEWALMFDDGENEARKDRLQQEMLNSDIAYSEDTVLEYERSHWMNEDEVPVFRDKLFKECEQNGLAELEGFKNLSD